MGCIRSQTIGQYVLILILRVIFFFYSDHDFSGFSISIHCLSHRKSYTCDQNFQFNQILHVNFPNFQLTQNEKLKHFTIVNLHFPVWHIEMEQPVIQIRLWRSRIHFPSTPTLCISRKQASRKSTHHFPLNITAGSELQVET